MFETLDMQITRPKELRKIVLLNALPISIFSEYVPALVYINKMDFSELMALLKNINVKIDSYIRHQGLLNLLARYGINLSPNNANYQFDINDFIVVIVLKSISITRGKEIEQLNENDIEIYNVQLLLDSKLDSKNDGGGTIEIS